MIKKALLSLFVITTFVIYSFHQRTNVPVVVPVVSDTTKTDTTSSLSNSSNTTTAPQTVASNSIYKDGTYTGKASDAYYGYIKVKVVVSGGKITDVIFLDHPSDRSTSIEINSQAMPMLKAQAIKAQSAKVNGVSGATDTSMAFIQSLDDALNQAKV